VKEPAFRPALQAQTMAFRPRENDFAARFQGA